MTNCCCSRSPTKWREKKAIEDPQARPLAPQAFRVPGITVGIASWPAKESTPLPANSFSLFCPESLVNLNRFARNIKNCQPSVAAVADQFTPVRQYDLHQAQRVRAVRDLVTYRGNLVSRLEGFLVPAGFRSSGLAIHGARSAARAIPGRRVSWTMSGASILRCSAYRRAKPSRWIRNNGSCFS